MSRRPGHRKFNVTQEEVISKGADGEEHFCNGGGWGLEGGGSGPSAEQTIDTGSPLIGSAIKVERLKEPRGRGGEGWGWGAAPPSLLLWLSEWDALQKREWGEQ